jgi:hypothetical protein
MVESIVQRGLYPVALASFFQGKRAAYHACGNEDAQIQLMEDLIKEVRDCELKSTLPPGWYMWRHKDRISVWTVGPKALFFPTYS